MRSTLIGISILLAIGSCSEEQGPEPTKEELRFVDAQGGLRMRKQPSTDAPVVTLIPNRAEVSVLQKDGPHATIAGNSGQWLNIRYQSQVGWVFDAYLAHSKPPEPVTADSCIETLDGFSGGCLGRSCEPGSSCGDKLVFNPNGTFDVIYCDGGSSGSWRIAGSQLIAETTSPGYSEGMCFGENYEQCIQELKRKYQDAEIRNTYTFSIESDGSVSRTLVTEYLGTFPAEAGINNRRRESTGTYECFHSL